MQNTAGRQDEPDDFDHLTAVEFDETGQFLATGDKSGNIVILENDKSKEHVHYAFFGEFTSHFPDFDFVRSQQIDEKINQIKFGRMTNDSIFLLTTNDRHIKLWKVKETEQYRIVNWNIDPQHIGFGYDPGNIERNPPEITNLKVPRKITTERAKMPHLRKTYADDVHTYNITSLAISPDRESFISGDNLRINLWDINVSNTSYNVLDIKPDDMQELSEIISSLDYHPSHSNQFLYSTTLGNIMTCDLRQRALVDEPSQVFSQRTDSGEGGTDGDQQESFFNEMTQNVTAARYSKGGKFIIARDYMTVKIWDVAMEKEPVETIYVHEYLRDKMWELYSSDLLWDPFTLGLSSRGDIVTGSYSNYFHIFDLGAKTDTFIQAAQQFVRTADLHRLNQPKIVSANGDTESKVTEKRRKGGFNPMNLFRKQNKSRKVSTESVKDKEEGYPHNIDFSSIEFNKKILDCAWHPEANTVAIAGQNNLYIYSKTRKPS